MKIKDIVSEHAKGRRAKVYAKKPINTVAPKKPEAPVSEDITASSGKIVANDGKTITVAMPDGTQIQKPLANALGQDQQGNPVFNVMNPQGTGTPTGQQADPATKLAAGSSIAVNTGTPTEDMTMGESHAGRIESLFNDWMNSEYAPYDDESGDDNAVIDKAIRFLSGNVPPLVPEDKVEDVAELLTRHFNGEVAETHHDVGGDPTDEFIRDVEVRESRSTKSADDILLGKMLNIAGLR